MHKGKVIVLQAVLRCLLHHLILKRNRVQKALLANTVSQGSKPSKCKSTSTTFTKFLMLMEPSKMFLKASAAKIYFSQGSLYSAAERIFHIPNISSCSASIMSMPPT